MKSRLALKFLVSGVLLAWVIFQTDCRSIWQAFSQCQPGFIVAAFALHWVGYWISVVRWRILLEALGGVPSFSQLFSSYLVGSFFNTLLPSTVGGDLSRTWDTRHHVGGSIPSFAVVFVERFTGMTAMVLIALVALPFARHAIPPGYFIAESVIGLAVAFTLVSLFISAPQTRRLFGEKGKVALFHQALTLYLNHPKKLLAAFVWGILLQLNVVLFYFFISYGLGMPMTFLFLLILVPIIKVILLLPFTVNGIGLRENAFAFFLQGKGVGIAQALALSWIDLGMTLLLALIGAAVYVARRNKNKTA